MIKGVITGDLVNSTNIAAEWRQAVVGALYKCAADFSPLTKTIRIGQFLSGCYWRKTVSLS